MGPGGLATPNRAGVCGRPPTNRPLLAVREDGGVYSPSLRSRAVRLPPTPCRVCFRPRVFNKFSHFSKHYRCSFHCCPQLVVLRVLASVGMAVRMICLAALLAAAQAADELQVRAGVRVGGASARRCSRCSWLSIGRSSSMKGPQSARRATASSLAISSACTIPERSTRLPRLARPASSSTAREAARCLTPGSALVRLSPAGTRV